MVHFAILPFCERQWFGVKGGASNASRGGFKVLGQGHSRSTHHHHITRSSIIATPA